MINKVYNKNYKHYFIIFLLWSITTLASAQTSFITTKMFAQVNIFYGFLPLHAQNTQHECSYTVYLACYLFIQKL